MAQAASAWSISDEPSTASPTETEYQMCPGMGFGTTVGQGQITQQISTDTCNQISLCSGFRAGIAMDDEHIKSKPGSKDLRSREQGAGRKEPSLGTKQ